MEPELPPLEPELELPLEPDEDDELCEWFMPELELDPPDPLDWLGVVGAGLGFGLAFFGLGFGLGLGLVAVAVLGVDGATGTGLELELDEPQPAITIAATAATAGIPCLGLSISLHDDAPSDKTFPGFILAPCTSVSSPRPSSGSWAV